VVRSLFKEGGGFYPDTYGEEFAAELSVKKTNNDGEG
jgi:hypothetical protein